MTSFASNGIFGLVAHWLEPRAERLGTWELRWLVALVVAFGASGVSQVSAESCSKSRDYILEGLAGDLVLPGTSYQNSFKICSETLTLTNVKDAYILKDGGIAIVPAHNSIFATAETLAQFCQHFPKKVARFLSPREQRKDLTLGLVVMMSSSGTPSCREINGTM